MTGVRLSLRVLSNLHFNSRISPKSFLFTYSASQSRTCWTHQRYLSTWLTSCSRPAHGLSSAISGSLVTTAPGISCLFNGIRHKSNKSQKQNRPGATEEDEDEDKLEIDPEDSDYEDEIVEATNIAKDYNDIEAAVQSFRFDVVFTAGTAMSRSKIEDAFYSGKLRLNGEKLWKKSRAVKVGDILDLVIKENRETATVMRAILKEVGKEKTSSDKHKVVLRRWKILTVEKTSEPPKFPTET